MTFEGNHLEASEQSLGERVKGASLHLSLVKVELAPKQLHAQQGKDDEEEEEQEQKGADGFHGVQQRVDQVRQSGPVSSSSSAREKRRLQPGRSYVFQPDIEKNPTAHRHQPKHYQIFTL